MKNSLKGTAFISLLLSLALIGCIKEDSPAPADNDNFDRSALLSQVSEQIIEAHANHNLNLANLSNDAAVFTANPNQSSLMQVRAQWHETLIDWQWVAPYEFAEAINKSFELTHNTYPVDTAVINSNIQSGNYNLNSAGNSAAIGLQAMDYLLNANSDQVTIDLFSNVSGASLRAQYLLDVLAQMKSKSDAMSAIWTAGSSEVSAFIASTGNDVGSSLGQFLNAFNKSLEVTTRSNKIGIPAGALTFSMTPLPGHVEAYYEKTNSVNYLRESVLAFQQIYLGGTGIGFDDYLVALNAQYNGQPLDQAIQGQFTVLISALNTLQSPLSDFVVNDQQAALDVYAELQELVVLFKVDMMSSLGVLITYQDNDGD